MSAPVPSPAQPRRAPFPRRADKARGGAALLEVIIALALFVATAAIITSALSASLESLDRQRRTLHASNLANSVMAELQLGIRAPGNSGAQPFEAPFDQWTWELAVTSSETETGESSDLTHAEVIIRHKEFPTVRRLAQLIAFDRSRRTATPAPAAARP